MKFKLLKYFSLFFILYGSLGCSLFGGKDAPAKEIEILNKADNYLSEGKIQEALKNYRFVQKKYPKSTYVLSAKLGEADCYLQQQAFSTAEVVYQEVYQKSKARYPDIYALAIYKLSFAFEALNDDVRALAYLKELNQYKENLPLEIQLAELPSRMSMLYSKLGKEKEAQNYLHLAEKGIKTLKDEGSGKDKKWLSKMYFQMGQVATYQLSPENFFFIVEGQKNNQKFLQLNLELNEEPWAQRSLQNLNASFRDLWNLVVTLPIQKNEDYKVALKMQKEKQLKMSLKFLELVDKAISLEPVSGEQQNPAQKEFYHFINEFKKTVINFNHSQPEINEVTDDSIEQLKKYKKYKKVPAPSNVPLVLPEKKGVENSSTDEKKKTSPSVNKQDPNL